MVTDHCREQSRDAQSRAGGLRQLRPFLLGWLIYVFLIGLIAVGVWIPQGIVERMDFRDLYAGGFLARTDPAHLYDLASQKRIEDALVSVRSGVLPFCHPAHEALLFVPLSLLSYRQAYLVMLLVNSLLIVCCFFAARDAFSNLLQPWQPRPGLIFFIFLPVTAGLAHGQDVMLLLLFCCLAWRELTRARLFSAGFLVALLLFKPQLALLLGFLLAVRYRWRFVAGFAAGAAAAAVASLSLVGPQGIRAFVDLLRTMSLAGAQNEEAQNVIGAYPHVMPNLRGLFYVAGGQHLPPTISFALVAIVTLALLAWSARVVRSKPEDEAFAFSIFCMMLLSYNGHITDMVVLLLPIVLLARRPRRFVETCLYGLFLLPPLLWIFSPQGKPGANFWLLSLPILAITVALGREPDAQCVPEVRTATQG